jgi:flagellar biosynthetic protein FliR
MIEFTSEQAALWIGSLFWPMVRILALISSAPLLSHRAFPTRTKVALAVAIAAVLAPGIESVPLGEALDATFFSLLLRNIAIGLAMGFSVRLVFTGIELAGQMVGLQVGLNIAGFFNPEASDTDNPIANFVSLVVLLLFLALDGHLALIAALARSFEAFPIAGHGDLTASVMPVVQLGSQIFASALSISLPILAVMLLVNLVLGVMARVSPQLNLFSVGFPMTLSAGLVVFFLFLPYLAPPIRAALERSLSLWPAG